MHDYNYYAYMYVYCSQTDYCMLLIFSGVCVSTEGILPDQRYPITAQA